MRAVTFIIQFATCLIRVATMKTFFQVLDNAIEACLLFFGFLFLFTLMSPFVIVMLLALKAMWGAVLR
jgi:hypothetical protein